MTPILYQLKHGENKIKGSIKTYGKALPGLKLWLIIDDTVQSSCSIFVIRSRERVSQDVGNLIDFSDDCAIFSSCAAPK